MMAEKLTRIHSPVRHLGLVLVMLWFAGTFAVSGAEPGPSRSPLVTTNVVLVTNIVTVTVTNLVVTTNAVVTTNGVTASSSSSALPDLSWVPPEDRFDWIQLKSGEWLKGRIKAMQDRELEFDSEELDDLTFDWKDIRQVRSSRILDVLFIDGELVSGPVAITPSEVSVGEETPRVLPRDQLQSLTPGGSKERNYWSGNISAGLTLRSGNTEQVDYTAQAHLQRRTPATRLSLDYIGNVSVQDSVESANNHRVNSEFDLWLSRKFYLILPFAEYYKDPFQNLKHRATVGVGVGYDLIVQPKLEWTITAGPAYQYSWFESAQAGERTEKGAGALAFGTRFDWDITRKIEFSLSYRGQYTSQEAGETTHHAVGTLSFDITKRFDLDISLSWDRIANPKVGSDGVQPEPDDFRLVLGLGVDF
jgi:putative salt-induced outer membrane protein YdiY